jgi:hypothetical protein
MSPVKKGYTRPLDLKHGRVDMSHGGGGRAMVQLITDLFAKHLGNEYLAQGNDGTWLPAGNGRLVVSTDSHVVSPLFFPGGDIGGLSVHGTVNDVAVMGATPLYLTAGFILEEGFPLADLARIVESMAQGRPRPASSWWPAIPRWSSRARAMACSSPPPASAFCPTASICPAIWRNRATCCWCPARSAITAWRS